MVQQKRYIVPLILIISLFFLWGFAHNLNPILIPHLKKACQLNDTESALIDSSFFIAYFLMALPAAYFMNKFGYKGGIIIGLILFACGAFLFNPAADTRQFGLFLFALFVIASGLTFLETAANPYVNELGDIKTSTQRLNLAQSFNGLAQTLAPLIGGEFILSGTTLDNSALSSMNPQQLSAYLDAEASSVKLPYLIIGLVVLLVALLIWRTPLPDIQEEKDNELEIKGSIFKEKNLMFSILAQFFYVGAQVGIASFFIRYCFYTDVVPEKEASRLLAAALLAFMIGRFIGTFLMKYIAPWKLLLTYSTLSIILIITSVIISGRSGIYSLMGVEFFMSIMFPTIFSLGIHGLGTKRKRGSSLLVMSIVGGAIIPLLMGRVSDLTKGNIQIAYLIPGVCFAVVLLFALSHRKHKSRESVIISSH
ncbi:MAG: L-fucose:H+ symporter permease [Taibaiella sp.]|jgi:FHS family L-fucose permease-like MFS transporter